MSKLVIEDYKDHRGKKAKKGILSDVTLLYTKIQNGGLKYKSKEKEFACAAVVDEDTADQYEDLFTQNKAKTIKTSEFEKKYKTEPPFPKNKKQYVINLHTSYYVNKSYKNKEGEVYLEKGSPIPYDWPNRPKVYAPNPDGEGVVDITRKSLVGNGSKGSIAFTIMQGDDKDYPYLADVLVTDLVEYEADSTVNSSFGTVAGGLDTPKPEEIEPEDKFCPEDGEGGSDFDEESQESEGDKPDLDETESESGPFDDDTPF